MTIAFSWSSNWECRCSYPFDWISFHFLDEDFSLCSSINLISCLDGFARIVSFCERQRLRFHHLLRFVSSQLPRCDQSETRQFGRKAEISHFLEFASSGLLLHLIVRQRLDRHSRKGCQQARKPAAVLGCDVRQSLLSRVDIRLLVVLDAFSRRQRNGLSADVRCFFPQVVESLDAHDDLSHCRHRNGCHPPRLQLPQEESLRHIFVHRRLHNVDFRSGLSFSFLDVSHSGNAEHLATSRVLRRLRRFAFVVLFRRRVRASAEVGSGGFLGKTKQVEEEEEVQLNA